MVRLMAATIVETEELTQEWSIWLTLTRLIHWQYSEAMQVGFSVISPYLLISIHDAEGKPAHDY